MLSYKDALQKVIESIAPLQSQQIALPEAAGLYLATSVSARWNMPRWDNSAMDGFAIGEIPTKKSEKLKIVGASYAGHPFNNSLKQNEAIRITTGARLPDGADTVIPIEDTVEEDGYLFLCQKATKGQFVRQEGKEFRSKETLIESGEILNAGEIGLLASAGVEQVSAIPQPKVAIFSTGDELVDFGQTPGPNQIINSSMQYLVARIRECGCTPIHLGTGKDCDSDLAKLIKQARTADLIISTGGVSVGEKDLVQQALVQQGFLRKFWKVAIKPGKPVLFGMLNNLPCFGLPGNPAATAATFELFVRPALRILSGCPSPQPIQIQAHLTKHVSAGENRQQFIWGKVQITAGQMYFAPSHFQDSGQNRGIQGAQALLPVPIGSPDLVVGDKVEIILLRLP